MRRGGPQKQYQVQRLRDQSCTSPSSQTHEPSTGRFSVAVRPETSSVFGTKVVAILYTNAAKSPNKRKLLHGSYLKQGLRRFYLGAGTCRHP